MKSYDTVCMIETFVFHALYVRTCKTKFEVAKILEYFTLDYFILKKSTSFVNFS